MGEGLERDNLGVVAPPPLVYLTGLVVGFALELLFHSPAFPRPLGWVVGGVLVLAGAALIMSFGVAFGRAHTPIDPRETPTAIVSTGPYRFTRNPAYLGFALIYAGLTLVVGALWPLLTLIPTLVAVDRLVIAREERYLEAKFGEEYIGYKSRVRRWV